MRRLIPPVPRGPAPQQDRPTEPAGRWPVYGIRLLAFAAAGFLFLQWHVLQSFCPWCTAADSCALALWFLVLYATFRRLALASAQHSGPGRSAVTLSVALGLAGTAALAAAQWRQPESYS